MPAVFNTLKTLSGELVKNTPISIRRLDNTLSPISGKTTIIGNWVKNVPFGRYEVSEFYGPQPVRYLIEVPDDASSHWVGDILEG